MIELVMVIVLIGIVAVFTYVRFPSATPFSLNSAADQLKADIRVAQTRAMSISNVTTSISITTNGYTVTGYSPVTLPAGVSFSPAQTITFNDDGVPGAATTVTVSVGGSTRVLTINGVTGYVSG